jgi:hypothetical protein
MRTETLMRVAPTLLVVNVVLVALAIIVTATR